MNDYYLLFICFETYFSSFHFLFFIFLGCAVRISPACVNTRAHLYIVTPYSQQQGKQSISVLTNYRVKSLLMITFVLCIKISLEHT